MLKEVWVRLSVIAFVCCLSVTAHAMADSKSHVNVPAGDLTTGLEMLARQSGAEFVYRVDQLKGLHTQGVAGDLSPKEAVTKLLIGTPLQLRMDATGAMLIAPVRANATASTSSATGSDGAQEGQRSSSEGFRVAQLAQGPDSQPAALGASAGNASIALEEVIVTAQKRSERLMDVPDAIGVISGQQLEAMNASSLTDFAGYVPGFTVAAGGSPGQNQLVIRGLSTGYSNTVTGPLVATYIDDVAVSSSTFATRGAMFGFDLMPYDIEQVEVLRGPQGTLYGAAAMGGLVKYSLRKPDLAEFSAEIGGNIETVDGSSSPSGGGRAAVNLPMITGTLGVRLSGFYESNAGYIDNIGTGIRNSNHSTESGGRAAVLWKPIDSLSVQATVLAQNINAADQSAVTLSSTTLEPIYGSLTQSTHFPQPFTQQARVYSLSVDWDVHFATLTNSASWSRLNSSTGSDFTPNYGEFVPYPNALVQYLFNDLGSKFVDEMRLTSPQNQRLEWMAGAFYTRENGTENGTNPAYTPEYEPLPADNVLVYTTQDYFKERAIFGNTTFKVTDRFDIGAGARYAQNSEVNCFPVNEGIFGGPSVPCNSRPYVGVATWMSDLRFHLNEDSMVYLRWATGYRAGGCNGGTGCQNNESLSIPGTFDPDKVANYEVGLKGALLDHRLQLDLSAFYIHWRDIQAQVINSLGIAYTGNGGTAKSNGVEWAGSYRVSDRLSLQATLTYTNAYLTQDAPGIGGRNGDQLPESPRWSGSLVAEYRQPLSNQAQLVLGGGYRYRDTVVNQFEGTGEPLPIGPQNIVDLYTGLMTKHVSGRLYAKNVFDNHSYMGLLYLADPTKPGFVPVQPRTIGLSVDYTF